MEKLEKSLRYNKGKLDWTLVDFESLEPMVQVLMFGAKKYDRDNWKKPTELDSIKQSMMRHAVALMKGEDIDPESGLPHVSHIMCNCMFYQHHWSKNNTFTAMAIKKFINTKKMIREAFKLILLIAQMGCLAWFFALTFIPHVPFVMAWAMGGLLALFFLAIFLMLTYITDNLPIGGGITFMDDPENGKWDETDHP